MYWFNSLWYSIFNFTSDSLIFTTANIACFTKKKRKKEKPPSSLLVPFPYYHLLSFDRETGWAEVERIVPASATLQQLQQKWLVTIIVAAVKKVLCQHTMQCQHTMPMPGLCVLCFHIKVSLDRWLKANCSIANNRIGLLPILRQYCSIVSLATLNIYPL